ncbi:hypothetical protein TNCV_109391 [Trichonephila clavipes]|nr:hypothetical protein TNCV_109391 [Trichonephila clavipes]
MRGFLTTGTSISFCSESCCASSISSSPVPSKSAPSTDGAEEGVGGGRGSSERALFEQVALGERSRQHRRFVSPFYPLNGVRWGGGETAAGFFSSSFFSAGGSLTLFLTRRTILSNSFSEAGIRKRNVQLNKKFNALTCLRHFLVVALQLGIVRPCIGGE